MFPGKPPPHPPPKIPATIASRTAPPLRNANRRGDPKRPDRPSNIPPTIPLQQSRPSGALFFALRKKRFRPDVPVFNRIAMVLQSQKPAFFPPAARSFLHNLSRNLHVIDHRHTVLHDRDRRQL